MSRSNVTVLPIARNVLDPGDATAMARIRQARDEMHLLERDLADTLERAALVQDEAVASILIAKDKGGLSLRFNPQWVRVASMIVLRARITDVIRGHGSHPVSNHGIRRAVTKV